MSKSNESNKSVNLEESSSALSSISGDHTPFKDHLSDVETMEKIEEVSAETLKKNKKTMLEKEEAIKISVKNASSLGNDHTPFEDNLGDVETMENTEEETNAETTSMKYKKTILENEETKISPPEDLSIPENTMDKSNQETTSKEEAESSTKFIIKRKVNRRGSNFRAKKEEAIKISVQKASSLGNDHTPFEDNLGDVETMKNIEEELNAETTSMKYKKTMLEKEETKISPPEDLLIPENTVDESNHETISEEVAESSTKFIIKKKVNRRGSHFRMKGQFCKQNENTLITKTMLEQEELLEQEILKEEEQLQKKMLEQSKLEKEQGFKRLQHLLSRSGVYAKYLAEKLEQQEEDLAKKQEKEKQRQKHNLTKNQELNGEPKSKAGGKRKAQHPTDASEVENVKNKKQKGPTQLNIRDYFTKEDLEKKALETTDLSHGYKESCTEDEVHEKQPKLFSGGVMRPYQIDGYEWLKVLYENGVNGILADEMGLGKTIQCIALISRLVEKNVPGPFFVCAPLSTLSNWVSEFKRFSPEIPVLLYHGDKAERMRLLTKIKKKVNVAGNLVHPVVITSYQIAIIERSKLARLEWKYLIIDEAHRIKNLHCRLVRELKQYNSLNRLLLTGTPLQNNLAELWSLLNFILPEIFDDLRVFESWFDISQLSKSEAAREIAAQEQEKQIISSIHQILTPFLLRRTKADITLLLPPKKELIVYAPLTSLQQQYYNAILNKTLELIAGVEKENKVEPEIDLSDGRPKRQRKEINYKECEEKYFISDDFVQESEDSSCNDILPSIKTHHIEINMKNTMMMLRKACSHPYLISQPIDPETKDCLIDEDIVKSTGKVLVLDLMLPELKKRGHRVLLFSQFVIMLDLLAEYCELRDYKYLRYDGTMKILERDNNIREFNENKECFIFLISTRAGGLGINLASADTVIFYDSDWNPQSDLQAQDRCHRIGQTKPVIVYRLVTKNTIDQKMVERATAKRKLEKMIIQKGRFSTNDTLTKSQKAITQEELLELLQSSDVEGFVDTKDSIFAPGELEALLDRSDMITI